jgi:hypothetical protein
MSEFEKLMRQIAKKGCHVIETYKKRFWPKTDL